MADIKQIKVSDVIYDIKDEVARAGMSTIMEAVKMFNNISVAKTAFASNTEIAECPFKATVALNGVDATYSPIVNFNTDIQFSGIQWVVDCGANSLILYASEVPAADFVINSVICMKVS